MDTYLKFLSSPDVGGNTASQMGGQNQNWSFPKIRGSDLDQASCYNDTHQQDHQFKEAAKYCRGLNGLHFAGLSEAVPMI